MFVVRQRFPKSRPLGFRHFKGNTIHFQLRHTNLASQKRQRCQPQTHGPDSVDFDALFWIRDRDVAGFKRNMAVLIQRQRRTAY